jgi:hypothetical protein
LLVTSLTEFEDYYGSFVSYGYVHQQVQTFFEEGGARCYVSRVVGASPNATSGQTTTGTITLDTASAQDAIILTAAGPGAWSANLDVSVVTLGNGFAVKLFLNDEQVYSTGECATATVAVNKINSSVIAGRYATAALATGADVVGRAMNYVYLEPLQLTVRRFAPHGTQAVELWSDWVCGGTILAQRDVAEAAGWFGDGNTAVDRFMLSGVTNNGGKIWRTFGAGYIYRRTFTFHTYVTNYSKYLNGANEQVVGIWDHPIFGGER